MTSPVLNYTARQVIASAYRAAGIIPAQQALQPFETDRGLEALNFLIKHWQAQDIHLWSKTEAVIPLVPTRKKYLLGPTGNEASNEDDFFFTNVETDAIATDTVIELFDVSGITGAPDILAFSPTVATQGWTGINSGTVSSDATSLKVTNGAGVAGGAEYTLDTVSGEEYIVSFDYTKGTSAAADFSIVSGSVLATLNLAVTGSGELRFTANLDNVTFRFENTSIVITEDSEASNLNYKKLSAGDNVGIELDNGTRQWTHVISVDSAPSPPTIRIQNALTDASTAGRIVYAYTDIISRPMRILQLRFADDVCASEIPTEQWSREEYFDQPDKLSSGTVVQWYYSPQLTDGALYVWQVASNINNICRVTYIRPLDISTELIDSPDIPSEWVEALRWNLARKLSIEFGGRSTQRYEQIAAEAAATLELALGYDEERDAVTIQPDYTGR